MPGEKRTPANQPLLTSGAVAELLHVHPKHVYRLLRRGLPGHRLGGEWRFEKEEVLAWAKQADAPLASPEGAATLGSVPPASPPPQLEPSFAQDPPPLIAANGDLCIEVLLRAVREAGKVTLGFVPTDRAEAKALVNAGRVLAAGVHGQGQSIGNERGQVRLHVVRRVVGLGFPKRRRLKDVTDIEPLRLASRPISAGVRGYLDEALKKQGIDPEVAHAGALILDSHRDVALAVASGQADVGLVSLAWAHRAGLEFLPLAEEDYDLSLKAESLTGDASRAIVHALQNAEVRRKMAGGAGYDVRDTGSLRL